MRFGQGIEKMIQMDKSTCQNNNQDVGIFGYPGKPTVDATLLLEDISVDYIVQPTHRLDSNACDALYHSVVKCRIRQYWFPLCQENILRDYDLAVKEVSTDRVIQRDFWRAHRRNEKGDIDHSLIPTDTGIQEWYIDTVAATKRRLSLRGRAILKQRNQVMFQITVMNWKQIEFMQLKLCDLM